jgi:hypothetical protein
VVAGTSTGPRGRSCSLPPFSGWFRVLDLSLDGKGSQMVQGYRAWGLGLSVMTLIAPTDHGGRADTARRAMPLLTKKKARPSTGSVQRWPPVGPRDLLN